MTTPPPTKKRKRSRNVACNICRTRHEKCDGNKPCGYCVRTKNDCVYPAPKKRGPKPGYRKAYAEKIAELEKLVAEQKQQIYTLTTAQNLRSITPAYPPVLSLSSTRTDVGLLNLSVVKRYAQQFHTAPLAAFLPTKMLCVPDTSNNQLTPELFQMYGLAAFGAQIEGKQAHYEQLLDMSRSSSCHLSTTLSGNTVAGNVILSTLLFFKADFRSSKHYSELAMKQSSDLIGLGPDSLDARLLHAQVKMHRVKFETPDEAIKVLRSLVCELLENASTSGQFRQIFIFSLLHQVQLVCDETFEKDECLDMVSRQTCLMAVDRAQQIIQEMSKEDPFNINLVRILRPLSRGVRATLSLACGNPNKAIKTAEALLEQLLTDGAPAFMSPIIIKTLIQIFGITGRKAPFQKTLYYLKEAATVFPLANALFEYMNDSLGGAIRSQDSINPTVIDCSNAFVRIGLDKEHEPCPQIRHEHLTLPSIIEYVQSKQDRLNDLNKNKLTFPSSPQTYSPDNTHDTCNEEDFAALNMDMAMSDLSLPTETSALFDMSLNTSDDWAL